MRLFTNLLATALVLFGAASASASSITMTSDYAGGPVPIGTLINVSIAFEATTTQVQLLSIGVQFDNSVLQYNPIPSAVAGTPSYILYGMGTVSGMMYTTSLAAVVPTWNLWPGIVPPGKSQVNVDFADATFVGTFVTGGPTVIAIIQLEVIGGSAGTIDITIAGGGNIYQVNNNPFAPVTLSGGPIDVIVPEPTTALLVGLGLVGLGVAGRRR